MNRLKQIYLNEVFKPFIMEMFFEIVENESTYNPNFKRESFFDKLYNYPLINKSVSSLFTIEDRPAGFTFFSSTDREGYLVYIYLKEEYRRGGIASGVLTSSLRKCVDIGLNRVSLDVRAENENALKLYQRNGFKPVNNLVSFRNESNSFYTNNIKNCRVEDQDKFTFQPLYRMICSSMDNLIENKPANKIENRPWERKLSILLKKIEDDNVSVKIIKTLDGRPSGYIIYEVKSYTIIIYDISCNSEIVLQEALSLILQKEKIIQSCFFYGEDRICEYFKNSGFFRDIKQIEMNRKII